MYSPHKHSYLQSRSSGVPPRIINRAVHKANSQIPIDEFDIEPPFNRLTSEQPCIPRCQVDVTRRAQAFGRLALPKLRKELHSQDLEIVNQAINSICDLVHDPEKGYEAIRLKIPDRMADLLTHKDPTVRERVCMALRTIAGLGDGKQAIVSNSIILENLMKLLQDSESSVKIKAASCIEMISSTWMYADILVDNDFIQKILEILPEEESEIQLILLRTLSQLMYCHGKDQALEKGAFDILVDFLENERDDILAAACDCLMLLTSSRAGKKESYKKNILIKLVRLLKNENPEVYSSAASAIMFCTVKTKAKLKASKFRMIPIRLVKLCNDWHRPRTQVFAMKALTNICEHPGVKRFVYDNYINDIEGIVVGENEDLKSIKKVLLEVVTRVPALY